jgi:hypothetical protein
MGRVARGVLVSIALLTAAGTAWAGQGQGGFTFRAPEGWLDISPGAPATNRERAPESFRKQVASEKYAFFAIEVGQDDDGFMENMNAIV